MSRLDATAGSFVVNNQVIRPVNFVFMDFVGDPVRACDAGFDINISGQAEADLNGLYKGVTGDFAELSPIKIGEGGSNTVSAKLSGIKTLDDDTLDVIGDRTRWQGRTAQVWRIVWDQLNAAQGTYQHYYTGYMVDCLIGGSVGEQFIEITIENYLAAFGQATNRTYLSQRDYDPGDASGEATLAIANGTNSMAGLTPTTSSGGMGMGPGEREYVNMF